VHEKLEELIVEALDIGDLSEVVDDINDF